MKRTKLFIIIAIALAVIMLPTIFLKGNKNYGDPTVPSIDDVSDSGWLNSWLKESLTEKESESSDATKPPEISKHEFEIGDFAGYSGSPYGVVNKNKPFFEKSELTAKAYEFYSDLDSLGRCGYTMACIGKETMPTEKRGKIGMIKPTGWHTVKYDCVDGKYLYNRCHLIGYQLTAENANEKNLITGTRYLNVEGMLPFENMVADYVKETGNHVLYRVTPVYTKDELVARGVLMEAFSIEDNGEGICFNIFCYNVQPNVEIDYATGESRLK